MALMTSGLNLINILS